MTLQELLEHVISRNGLTASRIGPMRTAVKQYAAMLGADPSRCTPDMYQLPRQQIRQVIEAKAPPQLGAHAVRNLKDNINFLLQRGITLQRLAPRESPLTSWRDTPKVPKHWKPQRQEGIPFQAYGLSPLPAALAAELTQYREWATSLFTPNRPARAKRRQVTMKKVLEMAARVAGFLVRVKQRDADTLTLRDLINPPLVEDYIAWLIARRGKVTRTPHYIVVDLRTIARHWLHDEAWAAELTRLLRSLPPADAVYDKRKRWLSLPELEAVGLSRYPLNAQRLHQSKLARQIHQHKAPARTSLRGMAVWVGHSLILRLLVRIPLRQRNVREMRLHDNLRRLPNGTWQLTFQGPELKIGRRKGRVNQITYSFPAELQGLLEEWLETWRPLLVTSPDPGYVFVTKRGGPYSVTTLGHLITRMTWKFGGVAVNPHMIRDIWATEYIKSTRDIIGAAYMLGDTVETVLKYYAHLLDADAEERAVQWLATRLQPHEPDRHAGRPAVDAAGGGGARRKAG
jgi:hypothetical protein